MEDRAIHPDRRPTLEAVVGHALTFTTWRSLAAGGLTDDQVVAVLVGLAGRVADGSIRADVWSKPSHRLARGRDATATMTRRRR